MAAGTYPRCPLCGREGYDIAASSAHRAAMNQSQARHLSYRLEALEARQASIQHLREHILNMCTMCQMLMIGISSPDDRIELQERIKKAIETLKGELARAA